MEQGYAILRKQNNTPPTDIRVLDYIPDDLEKFGGICAMDFETHGLNPITGSIRSISLANDYGTLAIDLDAVSKEDKVKFTKWLLKQKLIAHNAVFDAGWIYTKTGVMPEIHACTLNLFKLLATEGYTGQRWGLKTAMTDILGWPESNEADLSEWLKSNKLLKKDMAQAPFNILGPYNAMDSAATWQLYKYFRQVIKENNWEESVFNFHQRPFVTLIELFIEQQLEGITIDNIGLDAYDNELIKKIEKERQKFLKHSEVAPHMEVYKQAILDEIAQSLPEQYTKTGKIASNYTKKLEKIELIKKSVPFNIDSTQQLQWLLYERLHYSCPIVTKTGISTGAKSLKYLGELGKILKEYRHLRDRRKFITALKNVQIKGVLHPSLKIHGTVTGRSSGGVE